MMYRIATAHPALRDREFTDIHAARKAAAGWGFPLYLVRPVRPGQKLNLRGK